jgi:hypothetical protein
VSVIKFIHIAAFQQPDGLAANLICHSVIEMKLACAATNVNAALAHGRAMAAVNALTPVFHKIY